MTREEKLQYVEDMNNTLCELCQTYEAADCTGCSFARYIAVAGRAGVIITSLPAGNYIDIFVRFCDNFTNMNVMLVNGEPKAACSEDGEFLKFGEAPMDCVSDFLAAYIDYDEKEWKNAPVVRWDGDSWTEV